jgi:hypothetical protein
MVTKWRGLPGCSTRPTNRMNRKGGFPLRSGLVAYVERRSAIGATLPLAVVPAKDACRPPAAIRQPRHEGPLWVIRVILATGRPFPVFPAKQTCQAPLGMSQACHNRTHALQQERGYSIASSARVSTDSGTLRPRDFAVLRLITVSNFVGCSTGKSLGLAPLRILSTYDAE